MKRLLLVLWWLILVTPALALVNPEEAGRPLPDWLARISVGAGSELRSQFCAGALIGPRWVVTASGCFNDPYGILQSYRALEHTRYLVQLGRDKQYLAVTQVYQSADRGMVLMELEQAVAIKPLPIDTAPLSALYDQEVLILGQQSSAGLGHAYFNPGGPGDGSCSFQGNIVLGEGAHCYLFTTPLRHSVLVQGRARIIDPSGPGRPVGALNDAIKTVNTGRRLYLAFEEQGAYTCMEDMGLPILRRGVDGELAMVGLINASGGVLAVPVCGPTLANWFSVAGYYQDFFARVQAEAILRHLCPAAPVTKVEYQGDAVVRLSWEPVTAASGYRLYYTPRPGFAAISASDLGGRTELSTTLSRVAGYEVAVQAYNESCTSPVSTPLTLPAAL